MKKFVFACILLSLANAAALGQTITVTSPNGGENWALGSTHAITWTSAGVTGNVRILLYKGAVNLGIIRDDVPVTARSIDWVVGAYQGGTAVPGTDYKVRIRKMQTEILDVSNREFTISPAVVTPPPTPAGSITVTNPNGGETWWTGDTAYEVRWTASNIAGNVTIKLKKGGVAVKSWSAANSGSSYWMCTGIADGTDYRVRVESGDGVVFDESDRNFEIKTRTLSTPPPTSIPPAISVVAVNPAPIRVPRMIPLEITDFKINDGAERTDNGGVTMNHTVRGTPTHYRWKNEGMSDWSPWAVYAGPAPRAEIPQACGGHTIRFQVKDNERESNVAEDTINYLIYRDVKINAAEARGYCGPDWVFRITKRGCIDVYEPTCAQLQIGGGSISCQLRKFQLVEVPVGYDAEFLIFAGRFLKDGWTFVSSEWTYWYSDFVVNEASTSASSPEKGCSLLMAPSAGQQGIGYSIRLWVNIGQRGGGEFRLNSLTLRGPCDQPVSEAFR